MPNKTIKAMSFKKIFIFLALFGLPCTAPKSVLAERIPVGSVERVDAVKDTPVTDCKYSKADSVVIRYVHKYKDVAYIESLKTGQPVSVKLAQAVLESASGTSTLARKYSNHFGVKSFKRSERSVNMHDDTPEDMFRVYGSDRISFMDHSRVIMLRRYADCRALISSDDWCDCLQQKGYATSKTYAKNLKNTIKKYRLDELEN